MLSIKDRHGLETHLRRRRFFPERRESISVTTSQGRSTIASSARIFGESQLCNSFKAIGVCFRSCRFWLFRVFLSARKRGWFARHESYRREELEFIFPKKKKKKRTCSSVCQIYPCNLELRNPIRNG